MTQFITVKKAAELTGKSPSSIRRVIYPIIEENNHADRHHIQPSPDEALQLRTKGENFAWRLSEELLRREFPAEAEPQKAGTASQHRASTADGGDLLDMLRRELDIKNQQITQQSELMSRQMELISGLSERLREGNILIASLQKQLALPDQRANVVNATDLTTSTKTATNADANEAKRSTKSATEKGSKTPPKVAKPKGFFSRLFR